ncbi:MAG: hypothetical protein P4L99_03435 [Chthoniobacter sp.]|nr:hypothetical protein [Chthoniobacter sp.]
MKRSLPSLCAVLGAMIALATPSLLATDSIEEVIETLHQAENSPQPLPLLQKAQDQYQHYNPKVGGAHHIANNRAVKEHKEAAEARLQEAITLATDGKSATEKIKSTIAEMRLSAEFKH